MYMTVYIDFANRALPFIHEKGWNSPAIVGDAHPILNVYFFKVKQLLGGVVFIRNNVLYAIPRDNGNQLGRLKLMLEGKMCQ